MPKVSVPPVTVAGIITCGALMTFFLYSWLTSPLEPAHH